MKQADIVEGGRYTNGEGGIREVLRISIPVQLTCRVVKYRVVAEGSPRCQNVNGIYGCQLSAFASWATGTME